MSKWYKVTTVCEVYTDYVVWADSDYDARIKMYDQEHTYEGDEYGYKNEEVTDVVEVGK